MSFFSNFQLFSLSVFAADRHSWPPFFRSYRRWLSRCFCRALRLAARSSGGPSPFTPCLCCMPCAIFSYLSAAFCLLPARDRTRPFPIVQPAIQRPLSPGFLVHIHCLCAAFPAVLLRRQLHLQPCQLPEKCRFISPHIPLVHAALCRFFDHWASVGPSPTFCGTKKARSTAKAMLRAFLSAWQPLSVEQRQ